MPECKKKEKKKDIKMQNKGFSYNIVVKHLTGVPKNL